MNSGIEQQSKMQNCKQTGKRFAHWPTLKENLSHVCFFSDFLGQVGSDVHVFSADFGRFGLNFGVILAPF